ncbi:TetR family transcriptional regulator [Sinomonas notoginsengisoli]|uniref:TetR/AcrR family transcriptional regulator n=1 Tax=Sinomonas notoginsengisoli TaxID=1457311 RepID=UPI001F43AE8D|nr:TetR/AcrR family transcriptional regulator [Sinomonas notoginsengisoli]
MPAGASFEEPAGRRGKARQTRRAIVAAAAALFVEKGYTGTRMADIARAAGYSVQTVYFVFHTKPELLQACYARAVLGEDDPRPPQEQPFYAAMLAATSGEELIGHFASGNGEIQARAAGIEEVAREARHEPEARAVREYNEGLRREGYGEIIALLDERFGLRPGLGRAEALELLLMYGGAGPFNALVRDAGWELPRFVAWLRAVLVYELFSSPD